MKKPIAVIGMGCIFPDAMDLSEYWSNLVLGKDSIREISDDYWSIQDYYDTDPNKKDKTYSKNAGMVNDVEFDPFEFGIMPRDIESISVEQIFALIVAKQALIDAKMYGKNAKDFNRNKTGVILAAGIGKNAFSLNLRLQIPKLRKIMLNSGLSEQLIEIVLKKIEDSQVEWTENSNPGYLPNVVAGRIADRFSLFGTNCVVDAACASSLAALKCAVNELETEDCDIVLTGGVNLDCSEFSFVSFCKTPVISASDTVRPFHKDSDGMVLGDGVGIIILKRLEDAVRDKDKIYGVIRGIGSSGQGSSKGIFATSVEGQVKALQRSYESARIEPSSVSMIEAHGTGTRVGDNIELEALNQFFGAYDIPHEIGLGSVKSQIGHTRLAAGIAGIIKVLLALHQKVQPGTLHVEETSELLDKSHLKVISQTRPWFVNKLNPTRRAGVSAFGFGGTNYHVVLEEWKNERTDNYRIQHIAQSFVLNAPTKQALIIKCQEMLKELELTQERSITRYYGESDIDEKEHRIGFVAINVIDLKDKLKRATHKLEEGLDLQEWQQDGIYYRKQGLKEEDKIATFFCKPAKSIINMQREVALNYPEMLEAFEKVDNLRIQEQKAPISTIVYPFTIEKKDKSSSIIESDVSDTLLAHATVVTGLYRILKNRGFNSDYYVGWDVLDVVPKYASGRINEEQVYKEVVEVGELLSNVTNVEQLYEYRGMKVNAVIYENETRKQSPMAKEQSYKSLGYEKSEMDLSDCIKYICDKGIKVVVLFDPTEKIVEKVRSTLHTKESELVIFYTQSSNNSLFQLEQAITQLRVLGIKIKQDSYRAIQENEDYKEHKKKFMIKVNPRIYYSKEKEILVHKARSTELNQVKANAKEIAIDDNRDNKKEETYEINETHNSLLEFKNIDRLAVHNFLKSHSEQFNKLIDVLNKGVNQKEVKVIFQALNESSKRKFEYYKEYLKQKDIQLNESYKNAHKEIVEPPYMSEYKQKSTERIKNKEMRELQVCLKEISTKSSTCPLLRGGVVVILDNDGVALQVSKRLSMMGYHPILIDISNGLYPHGQYQTYPVSIQAEMDIKTLFEKIIRELKEPLTGFLYISSTESGNDIVQSGFDEVKTVFLMAKYFHLHSRTTGNKHGYKFFFNVVRKDGRLGTTGEDTNFMLGGLFGLGKSLADEWREHTLVKVIDVDVACSPTLCSEFVIEELQQGNNSYIEIGITPNGTRHYLGLEETMNKRINNKVLTKDDVILVTGGGKGITAKCIIHLAKKYSCKMVLLGRTELKDDVTWLFGCENKREVQNAVVAQMRATNQKLSIKEVASLTNSYFAQLSIRKTIQALKKGGSEVLYYACNVTDEVGVKTIIDKVTKQFGTITGFVHGAGVLADKHIQDKVEKDYDLVVGTKIKGLFACLHNIDLSQMKYIILFNSVAAFFGNKGQTDYAIANEIMNKLSYQLRQGYPDCETVSINWGPWDGGMVDQSLKEAMMARDISIIPLDRGTDIFVEQFEYENCKPQIVVYDNIYF